MPDTLATKPSSFFAFLDRATKWLQEERYSKRVFSCLLMLAALAATASYLVFFRTDLLGKDTRLALILLNVDLILLLLFAVLVAARLVRVWSDRKRAGTPSRLHLNLVLLFSILTITPAIVVTILSGIFFNVGVNGWFSQRVATALEESTAVAEAYLSEHKKVIGESVEGLAHIMAQQMPQLLQNQAFFNHALDVYAEMRGLSEMIVFDQSQVLARSQLSFSLQFEHIAPDALERARQGVVILASSSGDRVRALRQIPGTPAFVLAGRFVDSHVSRRIATVQEAVGEYRQVEAQLSKFSMIFVQIFLVTCLLLLFAAIWVGLTFATRLARPIEALIDAADKVREGNWSVQVAEDISASEVGTLSRAFNRMTSELESQKKALTEVNHQLDLRRRFMEDVLAGVTAGVINTSLKGTVRLFNPSASEILGPDRPLEKGRTLAKMFPELDAFLKEAHQSAQDHHQGQITFARQGVSRTLVVRVVAEHGQGYIITFDDITNLVNAQKKAAWADVARRLAHEIKNPLTPIQLSAERLQRKYLAEITSNPDNFKTCIATIIRQVEQIGHLVSEFSTFARMPAPVVVRENLVELVRQAMFLQQEAHPTLAFDLDLSHDRITVEADPNQLTQVMTNLLLNAAEAVTERVKKGLYPERPARVQATLSCAQDALTIIVDDTGEGFPVQDRELLMEPYMTSRVRGSGLGLAIARKIVTDHGGSVALLDSPLGGARVQLVFPRSMVVECESNKLKGTL